MPDIIALKCPHCGGNVSKTEMKCGYCGAEVILQSDLAPQEHSKIEAQTACPKCNLETRVTNLICPICGEILVKTFEDGIAVWSTLEEEYARREETMEREFFERVPSYNSGGLDANEFLYYCIGKYKENFYAVTNKRVIAFCPSKYPSYREIALDSIASVSPLTNDQIVVKSLNFKKDTFGFNVFTYDKKSRKIDGMSFEVRYCIVFWCYLINAIERHRACEKFSNDS